MLFDEVRAGEVLPSDPDVSALGRTVAPYTYRRASGMMIRVAFRAGRGAGVRWPSCPPPRGTTAASAYSGLMTTTYAALLRGINVGGNRKVPMAALRTLLEGLGHDGVRTYLQSGQAVFSAGHGDEDSLARELTGAIEKQFGFAVDVIVRDHAYLEAVAAACPFPAADLEAKQLHVTYFSAPVDADRFAGIDQAAFLPEEFRLGDRALYLYAPDGLGRSKLAEQLSRPRTNKGLIATTRNWNTVVKLVEMTRS